MTKVLNAAQIKAYHDDGFLTPFDLYSEQEAARLSTKFEALESTIGDEPQECLVERFPNLKFTFDTGIRSIIAVSVRLEDEFIGAMLLASVRSLAYTGEDLDMVYHVSTIIGERIAAMKNVV